MKLAVNVTIRMSLLVFDFEGSEFSAYLHQGTEQNILYICIIPKLYT